MEYTNILHTSDTYNRYEMTNCTKMAIVYYNITETMKAELSTMIKP